MNSIGFPNTDIYSDHEQGGEESFWPSFTDIMMVIVMTFLLITVAVILNNWKLINTLKESVAAERQAMMKAQTALQVVQTKAKENETLEERLARLESLLRSRTQNLQQIRQQQQQTLLALNNSQQQVEQAQASIQSLEQTKQKNIVFINQLQKEKNEATTAAQKIQATLLDTQQLLQTQKQQLTTLEQEKAQSLSAAQQAQANLVSVKEELENTGKELEALRQKDIEGNEKLVSLQGEFDQLDKKYQKLLRPARSTKGKHVVRVVLNKKNGKSYYQIADQGKALRVLNRKKLDTELTRLKKKHGDNLYVKIIIPESSNISHSSAWKFTSEILNKYDYYHSNKE